MSNCSENKNPLQRSGTSQLQRLLPGLAADYVRVDEKDYDSWIVFAAQFSRYINYFGSSDQASGNWTPFFTNDVSALLGSMAIQEISLYRLGIKKRFDFLKDDDNRLATAALRRNLGELFAAVFTLARALDNYLQKIQTYNNTNKLSGITDQEIALKVTLENLIRTKLAPALRRLIGYHKAASSAPLTYLAPGDLDGWEILNAPVAEASSVLIGTDLSEAWWIFPASVPLVDRNWDKHVQDTPADTSIFLSPALPVVLNAIDGTDPDIIFQRINHAANHNLFAGIFDQFLMGYTRVIQEAEKELLKTLGEWDSHPPHYTLFLAFLKLFRHAQTHLNTFTKRHLDYYYQEVLKLVPREAQPNHAHILVELAKPVDDFLLEKDTLFKAGKDSEGKEVLYALDDNETFNKATVASFKSVYIGNDDDEHALGTTLPVILVDNDQRLFAAPVANSSDGLGAELITPNKEWHPFVNKLYREAKLTDIATPNAQIGFALASHYLYLSEGKRTVRIRLATNDNAALNALDAHVTGFLTTEKEWYAVTSVSIAAANMTDGTSCSEISFTLSGDAPPIVNYNAKVHGGTFVSAIPMVRIVLKNEDTSSYAYHTIRHLTVTKTEIRVEVGSPASGYTQDGIKQLLLSNDFGPIDASKPFQPFGAQPKKDSTLVIGHKEVFTKKNASVKLNFEWGALPATSTDVDYDISPATDPPYAPNVKVNFLASGIWKSHDEIAGIPATADVLSGITTKVQIFAASQAVPDSAIAPYDETFDQYNTASRKGFIRFVLNGAFGHKEYADKLSEYLINLANDKAGTKPNEPYSPTLQSVYLSYSAYVVQDVSSTAESSFSTRGIQLFHLYPFGEAEQHAFITKKNNPAQNTINIPLFPQFTHVNAQNSQVPSIGEFYVGLKDMHAQQSVNLLFQVLEGSSDPLLPKPADHVNWSYLSNNAWKDFSNQDISDATRQLIQSGIITFKLPANATTANTLLPAGYVWLRACVANYAQAVCALLNVHAQASIVTFSPNNNAADFLNNALPAGSVSKLKNPLSAVKKITQPYPSFGGRVKETYQQFCVRVSERLRHKGRAITIWDYEHLVLQAFPQIHKAKCLNHTRFAANPTTGAIAYNETKPGYVTIITIPSLVNRNDVNPLKPYTNQSVLQEIKAYLQQRISCHVKLEVANPQFEEVRLWFFMKLADGFTDYTYYRRKLQEEIVSYLTPWAYNTQAEVQFGGKIYKSSLINFIEERPYVNYITEVQMFLRVSESTPESGDLDEIEASTARSILVSAAASQHTIEEVDEDDDAVVTSCANHNKA